MDANDQGLHLGALGVRDVQLQFPSTNLGVDHVLFKLDCLKRKRRAETAGDE